VQISKYRVLFAVTFLVIAAGSARAQSDRYVDNYYPKPALVEVYKARASTMNKVARHHRIGFVLGVVKDISSKPYPAHVAVFAKGKGATKLIIVSQVAGRLDTIFRVRAYLAMLTSSARMTPIFQKMKVEDRFTFLDLIKMLGFKSVTVSDGDTFAHQIVVQ